MDSSISNFQNLLLEGLSDSAALPVAVEYLAKICDAPTAQIIFIGDGHTILQSTIVGTVDQELFQREGEYWHINPRTRQLDDMGVGTIIREQDFITADEVARDQAYQELLIPANVGHFAGAILEKDRNQIAALAIAQPYTHGAVNDNQTQCFRRAINAARPVLDLAKRIRQSGYSAILSSFSTCARVAILKADATVLDQSPAFETLLSEGLIRLDSFGQLDLMSDEANKRLAAAIRPASGVIGGRFVFARLRPDAGYMCVVTPIMKANDVASLSGAAIIVLEPLFQDRHIDHALLTEAFSLTDAECVIAERLFNGDTLKEIAAYRNVAPSTVKTMLKSIMLKTDSCRQAEVVTKLSRLAFPVGR